MAGSAPVPFEGVSVLFYFSGNGYSSARIVHLTGEHFSIISTQMKLFSYVAYFEKLEFVTLEFEPKLELFNGFSILKAV